MKNRILSLLLVLLMVVSLIPGSVFAAEDCNCDLTDGVHDATCPNYVCPDCGTAGWHETCPEAGDDTGSDEQPGASDETETPAEGEDETETPAEDCNCDLTDGVHDATCPNYVCPDCGTAGWHETCPEEGDDTGSDEQPGASDETETPAEGEDETPAEGEDETEEPGGEDPTETAACEVCGADPCTCEQAEASCPYCDYTLAEDGTVIHSTNCYAEYAYDGTADVGKYVQLIPEVAENGVSVSADPLTDDGIWYYYYEFGDNTVMKITDWYWDPDTSGLWYCVELYKGAFPESAEEYQWPVPAWILQDYTDYTYDYDAVLEFVSITCDICGKEGCTAEHVVCELCGNYDCTVQHTYCGGCGALDCTTEHIACPICHILDCGLEHEQPEQEEYTPLTAPVIPEDPQLPEEYDVAIVDASGTSVTESGIRLESGEQASLSAWSALGEDVSYQWQIFIDEGDGYWVDITGQTGKGLLFSRAMVMSALDDSGCARLRCVTDNGSETAVSAEVSVDAGTGISDESAELSVSMLATRALTLASGGDVDNEDIIYHTVTILYVYTDDTDTNGNSLSKFAGQRISLPYIVEVPHGETPPIRTVKSPSCVGYTPDAASIELQSLGVIEEDTTKVVEFYPAEVSYTVRHYVQNVDDDEYVWIDTTMATGKTESLTSDSAAKNYVGFTALSHYREEIAADSSTTIDIYYDRDYYLFTFEQGGGHGVSPIYARYGAELNVGTPTRPGYIFLGWKLNGTGDVISSANLPKTMPAENRTYVAVWEADENGEYTTVYWIKDGDTEIFVGSEIKNAKPDTAVSGEDDLSITTNVCGLPEHTHTTCTKTCVLDEHTHGDGNCLYNCGKTFHDHTSGCVPAQGHTHTRGCYNFTSATVNDNSSDRYGSKYGDKDGFEIYWRSEWNYYGTTYYYYVRINNRYYQITNYSDDLSLAFTYTSANCCTVEVHDHSDCTCIVTPHIHGAGCYSCGAIEHTHSNACKSDLAKYVDFVEADQNVTVMGDGSTVVNVYYEYRTYTIRFIYARQNGSSYQIATLTRNGVLSNCQWTAANSLPTVTDPSGATERSSVEIDGRTYYYISLKAKFGADISAIWPSANIGNTGNYEWGSWAAAAGTGYRETYGDEHANIVGPYPVMSADMIVDDPEKLADGTYLAQNMIAWWGNSSNNIENHAYHLYFELLPGADTTGAKYYNGKYYELVETYTFTAAHNGSTRVDPIYFNGFQCINNDTDAQENSSNFANNGNCPICGDGCAYCNDFYYDRGLRKLYFWNYNGPMSVSGEKDYEELPYGVSLAQYGQDVNAQFMLNNYPADLEPNAYAFAGWYTTAECYDGTEMDWSSTMPDADMTVYAKWAPVTHEVSIYLTEEGARYNDSDLQIGSTVSVTHNELVPEGNRPVITSLKHPLDESATFISWFYRDENGDEQAFDFETISVTSDMKIYAKWRSNVIKQVEISYVYVDDYGQKIYISDTEILTMRLGQTRTFDAKTGTSLYPEYQSKYFPATATHSITIAEGDIESVNAVTYEFEYKHYGKVPYQVEFYVEELDGTRRPAYKVTGGKAEFVDSNTYATWTQSQKDAFVASNQPDPNNTVLVEGGQYVERHWSNDKAAVVELFEPDDLAVATWVLPDEYLPNALKVQKIIVPSDVDGEDPETAIWQNTIVFIYQHTKPVDPDNPDIPDPDPDPDNPTYKARYLVQHFIESSTVSGQYTLYRYSDLSGVSGETATANPISAPGYTYSYGVTDEEKQSGTSLDVGADGTMGTEDDVLSGTITADDKLELNFYYKVNPYPYRVLYLEEGTNIELAPEKTTDGDGDLLTGLYGAQVTETAIPIEGYDVFGDPEKTIEIQMEVGDTASVNTIVFYYKLKSAQLVISKKVELDPTQAAQEGISEIPDWVYDQEFVFTIYRPEGFPKSLYHYTFTDVGGTTEERVVAAGTQTIEITLKHGQSAQFDEFPMGTYTVTETYVPGFRAIVGGIIAQAHDRTLDVDGEVEELNFVNRFPFYVGDLVVKKKVTKLDEANDPTATEPYKVTVVLTPDDSAREIDRVITWTDADGTARTFTVPKLSSSTATTYTFEILVPVDGEVKMEGVPVGSFTVTEVPQGTIGYITDYYKVTYNKAQNENHTAFGTNHVVNGVIHGGHLAAVTFNNTYKKGSLTINKTVTLEYDKDNWTSDTFTFTVTGTTELPDGTYHITVGGAASTVVVTGGKLTLTGSITVSKAGDAPWSGSLTFANLPAGYYTVTETAGLGNDKYTATILCDPDTGLVNDTETSAKFNFTNEFKQQAADFTITRKDAASDDQVFVYRVEGSGLSIDVTVVGNGSVTIANLPVGEYKVTQLNDWSWRYSDGAKTVEHTAVGTTVTFADDPDGVEADDVKTQWLSGNSSLWRNARNATAPAVFTNGVQVVSDDEDEEGTE